MRQIRTSGSEGGEAAIKAVFPTPIENGSSCKLAIQWHARIYCHASHRPGRAKPRSDTIGISADILW